MIQMIEIFFVQYLQFLLFCRVAVIHEFHYTIPMTSRNYFQGKRIAVIGLGPHGEISDAKFLIKENALVSVYDLRSEARLKEHIVYLREAGLLTMSAAQFRRTTFWTWTSSSCRTNIRAIRRSSRP